MHAPGACVRGIDEDPPRQLSLNVQVELLDIRRLICGVGSLTEFPPASKAETLPPAKGC